MDGIELLKALTTRAIDYRNIAQTSLQNNTHMNELEDGEIVQQRIIDAVLVDFINSIGMKLGIDYALYTCDLEDKPNTNDH